jgi:uncharacterized protein (DUF779 family)
MSVDNLYNEIEPEYDLSTLKVRKKGGGVKSDPEIRIPRVKITEEAAKVVEQLRAKHGDLMFHQSGGCCDGSSPMCYPKGEFMVGSSDVWLGEVAGCDFYMAKDQFEFWRHTELTIDITKGRGASFSLEIPLGLRFVTKSRVFTYEESQNLTHTHLGDAVTA